MSTARDLLRLAAPRIAAGEIGLRTSWDGTDLTINVYDVRHSTTPQDTGKPYLEYVKHPAVPTGRTADEEFAALIDGIPADVLDRDCDRPTA